MGEWQLLSLKTYLKILFLQQYTLLEMQLEAVKI